MRSTERPLIPDALTLTVQETPADVGRDVPDGYCSFFRAVGAWLRR